MASNSSADRRRRYLSSAVVSLVGVAMLGVPLYDVYDDVTSLGWSLGATLVENSVLVVLASGLVAGGVWLARRDWEPRHVETVSTWTLAGTAGTALAFAWVGALQLWSMHALKPVVLALDGVLFGAVATFGVGIYSARTDRHTEELERERERFAGLFTNTSDAVAALGVGADGVSVAMVNDEFRGQFGDDPERVFDDALAALDGVTDRRDLATRLRDGETLETDLHVHGDTDDEQGAFLVRFVPYEDRDTAAHCYLVATDVTERRRLARERERNHRLTELHRTASTLQETTDDASACETALDAVERLLDPARSRVVLDGDGESRVFERTADDATARPETTVRSWLGDGGSSKSRPPPSTPTSTTGRSSTCSAPTSTGHSTDSNANVASKRSASNSSSSTGRCVTTCSTTSRSSARASNSSNATTSTSRTTATSSPNTSTRWPSSSRRCGPTCRRSSTTASGRSNRGPSGRSSPTRSRRRDATTRRRRSRSATSPTSKSPRTTSSARSSRTC
ncbi:PAS domain-containing protein [Halospeciosus flavus]|uniref:PAS domain-containing protein n=1 Tax=Halospeciosus flavus TaxID=3032283 RepID=UPI003608B304